MMNVLIACEESQRVCTAFRTLGHNAFSCDIQEPSGGHPEWHIQDDVTLLLNPMRHLPSDCEAISFYTMDDKYYQIDKWDLIIARPPCTYLSKVAKRHHSLKCTPLEKINKRTGNRINAMAFFMKFANADCEHIAIENPRGIMNTAYRQPDQTIDPYMFAKSVNDTENYVTKATCLWLKGLPTLKTNDLPKPNNKEIFGQHPTGKARDWECSVVGKDMAKVRSKTFEGIARAMAEQWSKYIISERNGQ